MRTPTRGLSKLPTPAGFLVVVGLSLLLFISAGASWAQDSEEGDGDEGETETETAEDGTQTPTAKPPFFLKFENTPKAGVKATVRQIKSYGQLLTSTTMAKGAQINSTLDWSWDDYRQQEKTSEKRSEALNYTSGIVLPVIVSLTANWDWGQDKTLNNAGLANIARRDFKMMGLNVSKAGLKKGDFSTTVSGRAGLKEQKAVNQGIHNDFSEASLGARVQTEFEPNDGLKIVGKVYGQTVGGDRSLGQSTSPSAAIEDSLGLRVNFDRRYTKGFVALTRSHYEEEFLDFNRNSTGLIDTLDWSERGIDKIVDEMKTKNAIELEMENLTRVGRFGFKTQAKHTASSQDYMSNKLGRTERAEDRLNLTLFHASQRDSIAMVYGYKWRWDDQRIKDAFANRGRQFNKDRSLNLYWVHQLFRATETILKYEQSLGQSIAENLFNQNDRDRVRNDLTFGIKRDWDSGFVADMLFAYKSAEDISIRATRSANNNLKDSFEIAPSYDWPVASWLILNQNYRVYIQYTDFSYSDLESVNKDDNYNKRGNMNTKVTLKPTRRLTVTVRHDYNKRFNATRTETDATDTDFYHVDDRQVTSVIDLGVKLVVMPGFTLEGATYNSLDEKERIGAQTTTSENRAGQVWAGALLNTQFGPASKPIDVYAMVKKHNAFGPAVTATSADFWEADVWLKWKF